MSYGPDSLQGMIAGYVGELTGKQGENNISAYTRLTVGEMRSAVDLITHRHGHQRGVPTKADSSVRGNVIENPQFSYSLLFVNNNYN